MCSRCASSGCLGMAMPPSHIHSPCCLHSALGLQIFCVTYCAQSLMEAQQQRDWLASCNRRIQSFWTGSSSSWSRLPLQIFAVVLDLDPLLYADCAPLRCTTPCSTLKGKIHKATAQSVIYNDAHGRLASAASAGLARCLAWTFKLCKVCFFAIP